MHSIQLNQAEPRANPTNIHFPQNTKYICNIYQYFMRIFRSFVNYCFSCCCLKFLLFWPSLVLFLVSPQYIGFSFVLNSVCLLLSVCVPTFFIWFFFHSVAGCWWQLATDLSWLCSFRASPKYSKRLEYCMKSRSGFTESFAFYILLLSPRPSIISVAHVCNVHTGNSMLSTFVRLPWRCS